MAEAEEPLIVGSDSEGYEGYLAENNESQKWVILKGYRLYFYEDPEDQRQYQRVIDLAKYQSVRRAGKCCLKYTSSSFYLLPRLRGKKKPAKRLQFEAQTTEERGKWISSLRKQLPDKQGTTVQWKNQYETICGYWLLVLCSIMGLIFFIGIALNLAASKQNRWIHAFCIPLSLYQYL